MIDLLSIITAAVPMDKLVSAIGGDMLGDIGKDIEEIPEKIKEVQKAKEEADKEPNETIKKKSKERLDQVEKDLENRKEELEKKLEEIKDQIKKKVEDSAKEAQVYADKVVQAGQAIPPAVTGYMTALASLITQAAGAISAAIINPGSASFTTPSILAATQNVNKTKGDLKAAALDLTASVSQVDKALGLVFSAPIVGAVLKVAVMTPINTVAKVVETAIKIIP